MQIAHGWQARKPSKLVRLFLAAAALIGAAGVDCGVEFFVIGLLASYRCGDW